MDSGAPTMLVITGAAGAGKSTVCAALAGRPGLVALDGDVIASRAAAVANGRRDYARFWGYVLDLAAEMHRNGLTPVVGCICLPEQVIDRPSVVPVHFLALVANPSRRATRIAARSSQQPRIDNAFHDGIDLALRSRSVRAPHSYRVVDTSRMPVTAAVEVAAGWAEYVVSC